MNLCGTPRGSNLHPAIVVVLLEIHIVHDGTHVHDDSIGHALVRRLQLRLTLQQTAMVSIGCASGQILQIIVF